MEKQLKDFNKNKIFYKYINKSEKRNSNIKDIHFFIYINIKNKFIKINLKIIILFLIIYVNYYIYYVNQNKKMKEIKHKIDYEKNSFVILRRTLCDACGLFSFYMVYLGCINNWITKGYIPIVDMKSFPNVYNNYKISNYNSWEIFFDQPFGYNLEEIINNAKNKNYVECLPLENRPNEITIYDNQVLIDFWQNFAKKYMPIKKEIINKSYIIMKKLFYNSKNILGVKMRGTDYIINKMKGHSILPNLDTAIMDVKSFNEKNKYDFIFISTEDEIIKERFIKEFQNKIKILNPDEKIHYNYKEGKPINLHNNIIGNLEYSKNYIYNIIILSKCTDIIMVRGNGACMVYLLNNQFRNILIYNLGVY